MTTTELVVQDVRPGAPEEPPAPAAWSRRRLLAAVVGGGALAVTAPVWLIPWGAGPATAVPVVRGPGTWTSFGTVAVLAVSRTLLAAGATGHQHADPTADDGLGSPAWTSVIRVDLQVLNGLQRPVVLSPGQFRLWLGRSRTTVAPYDSERRAEILPPGRTTGLWISYLAPDAEPDLRLEYDDTGLAPRLLLPLTPAGAGGAR